MDANSALQVVGRVDESRTQSPEAESVENAANDKSESQLCRRVRVEYVDRPEWADDITTELLVESLFVDFMAKHFPRYANRFPTDSSTLPPTMEHEG